MELNEAKTSRINAKRSYALREVSFDLDALDERIAEIEQRDGSARGHFWNNNEQAQKVIAENNI